jgi:hypothetical protein
MKKIKIGLFMGVIAGVLDVIPMLIQKLPWEANISAFLMCIVTGFFISTSTLVIKPALKGLIISLLVLLPAALLIGWAEPFSLIPVLVMTIILGSLLGYFIEKFLK